MLPIPLSVGGDELTRLSFNFLAKLPILKHSNETSGLSTSNHATIIYAGCVQCEMVLLTSKDEGSTLGLDSFHESKAGRFVSNVK